MGIVLPFSRGAAPEEEPARPFVQEPVDTLWMLTPGGTQAFKALECLWDYCVGDLTGKPDADMMKYLQTHTLTSCAAFELYKDEFTLDGREDETRAAWLVLKFFLRSPQAHSWISLPDTVTQQLAFFTDRRHYFPVMGDTLDEPTAMLIGLQNMTAFAAIKRDYERDGIPADEEALNKTDEQKFFALQIINDRPVHATRLHAAMQAAAHDLLAFFRRARIPDHSGWLRQINPS